MKLHASLLADFYKTGHRAQDPKGTDFTYTNWTARSNNHFPIKGVDRVVMYGLQGILKWLLIDMWNETFFHKPLIEVLAHYKRRMDTSLGEGTVSLDHIEALHKLGYLPIRIKALPEGSIVPFKVAMMTTCNTHKDFAWLANYIEDMLSCEFWPVLTTTTCSYELRKILDKHAEATSTPKAVVDWQGHDFAFRGMRGIHDAAQSLSGHLLFGYGTDTMPVLDYIEQYYGGMNTFLGGSVPATEHKVMCLNISLEMKRIQDESAEVIPADELWYQAEKIVINRLITETYPVGVVSIVSDTKNLWDVLTRITVELRDVILNRTPNSLGMAKVVFRPDSGNPLKIICGSVKVENLDEGDLTFDQAKATAADILSERVADATPHGEHGESEVEGFFSFKGTVYKMVLDIEWNRHDKQYYYMDHSKVLSFEETVLTPEQKGAVQCLWEVFGGTTTETGHKMLHERVGLIYGDSIRTPVADAILTRLREMGFASGCVFFGRGSYEAVYATRDSTGSAIKATYGEVEGEPLELYKDPITDSGTKKSAKGLIRVEEEGDTFVMYDQQTPEQEVVGALLVVFENSKIYNEQDYSQVRAKLGFVA